MNRFHLFICTALSLLTLPTFAEEAKESIKLDGYIRSALESDTLRNADIFHEGKITLKTKRRKSLRAILEVEAETKKDALDVKEVLIERRWDERKEWELGYGLKRFGLQYEESSLERLTVNRSLVYRKLDIFNYTGRETGFRLGERDSSGEYHDFAYAFGLSEAQNLSLLAQWQTALSDEQVLRWGSWLQLVSDKIEKGRQLAGVMTHALWARNEASRWQLEWTLGLDPDQTEFNILYSDARKIYFSAAHGLYEWNAWQQDEEKLALVVGPGIYLGDLRDSRVHELNLLLGTRYSFDRLRVSFNLDLVGSNSPLDKKHYRFEESRAVLEALYEI